MFLFFLFLLFVNGKNFVASRQHEDPSFIHILHGVFMHSAPIEHHRVNEQWADSNVNILKPETSEIFATCPDSVEVNGCLLDVLKALIKFSPELLPVEEVIPMTVRSAEDPEMLPFLERHNAVEFFFSKINNLSTKHTELLLSTNWWP